MMAGNMVLIPAGEFEMGDGKGEDSPKHRVWLDAYYIGETCVTNAQYAEFVRSGGGRKPDNDRWDNPEFAEHPVTDVDWEDASAYAAWAGCELPAEAQWEKAARGPEGYIYPWGNEWDPSKCRHGKNHDDETTAPVTAYPDGRSGYGTYQQSSNVWEWCQDWYDTDYYRSDAATHNPEGPSVGSSRILRGGTCFGCAYRGWLDPKRRDNYVGFRLAKRADTPTTDGKADQKTLGCDDINWEALGRLLRYGDGASTTWSDELAETGGRIPGLDEIKSWYVEWHNTVDADANVMYDSSQGVMQMVEPRHTTQVRVPLSLYAEARIEAGRRQVSFNELVVTALKLMMSASSGNKKEA